MFDQFVFWTITYARTYVSGLPGGEGPANFRITLGGLFSSNPCFWILAALGAVVMWWEDRLKGGRYFLTALTVCSLAAVSAGFFFREHYFILLLPSVAWLAGIAISRGLFVLRHDRTIELFIAVPTLLLLPIGIAVSCIVFGSHWFALSPEAASQRIYSTSLFADAAKAADYIRQRTTKDATIAVLGSEPEIYFYARRRSASGYIYTYPLMETHSHALKMQQQMINEIEQARPDYMVFVQDHYSWLARERSEKNLLDWWERYWPVQYDVELTLDVSSEIESDTLPFGDENVTRQNGPQTRRYLLVLKRKPTSTQHSTKASQ